MIEQKNLNNEEIGNRVHSLFQSGKYDYWSIDGISKRLGIIEKLNIEKVLQTDKRFRMAWLKAEDWGNLYALMDKPIKGRERFAQFIANIRNYRKPFRDDYALEYS